jgi:hypothetical protein
MVEEGDRRELKRYIFQRVKDMRVAGIPHEKVKKLHALPHENAQQKQEATVTYPSAPASCKSGKEKNAEDDRQRQIQYYLMFRSQPLSPQRSSIYALYPYSLPYISGDCNIKSPKNFT